MPPAPHVQAPLPLSSADQQLIYDIDDGGYFSVYAPFEGGYRFYYAAGVQLVAYARYQELVQAGWITARGTLTAQAYTFLYGDPS